MKIETDKRNLLNMLLELKYQHPKQINSTLFKKLFKMSLKFKHNNLNDQQTKIPKIEESEIMKYKIDYCENECMIFYKETENLIKCTKCGSNRFKKCNKDLCSNKTYEQCNHNIKYRTSIKCCFYIPSKYYL